MRGWSNGQKNEVFPEVRERAVRLVLDQPGEHDSQWGAIVSVSTKMGCVSETISKRVRRVERDLGQRAGLTSSEREQLKALERENRELRRANEILRKSPAISPRRNSTVDRSDVIVANANTRHGLRDSTRTVSGKSGAVHTCSCA